MKFESPYKLGIASPVTLVQKRLWYFREEDNKNKQPAKQKNPTKILNKTKQRKEVKKEIEWSCSQNYFYSICQIVDKTE